MPPISRNHGAVGSTHLTDLLKNAAGQDGRLSRQDAKTLVADLKKAGRGTEALAAQEIFTAIESAERARGGQVTGFDLEKYRGQIEDTLEDADLNLDGMLSRAEIEQVKTTGRALLEVGQTLAMAPAKGRVSHNTVKSGLEHTAALIVRAAGPDGITSRDDMEMLVGTLNQTGRGTEALAVEFWFKHTDHRDHKPGARITAADIEKSLLYSDSRLLRAKDENKNGYSKKEIGRFSTSAKAFLLIGKMIDAGLLKQVQNRAPLPAKGREVLTDRNSQVLSQAFSAVAYTLGLDEHVTTRARFKPTTETLDTDRAEELHAGVFGGSPGADYRAMSEPQLRAFLDTTFGLTDSTTERSGLMDSLIAALNTRHGEAPQIFVAASAEAGTEDGAEVLLAFPNAGIAYGLDLMV